MILGPTARPFVVLGGEFARSMRRRGELVLAFHDISRRVKDGEFKVSRMDEAIQWSQSLLSFDAGPSALHKTPRRLSTSKCKGTRMGPKRDLGGWGYGRGRSCWKLKGVRGRTRYQQLNLEYLTPLHYTFCRTRILVQILSNQPNGKLHK